MAESSLWTIGKRHLLRDIIFNLLPTLLLIYLFFKKSKKVLLNGGLLSIILASVAIYAIVKFAASTLYSIYIRKIRRPKIPLSTYSGKWAIITGATSAVGSAFAFQFATKCNMNLCLIGRNGDKLNKLASHIQTITKKQRNKVQVITIANDFGSNNPDPNFNFHTHLDIQLGKMVAQYKATGKGGIGALVNCMNYRNEIPCIYHEHDLSDVERMMKTNVEGTLEIINSVLSYLRQQGRGYGSAIITVSSHSSFHPTPMMSVYSATNACRDAYGKQYYDEYKKQYGIEFLSVTPELMSSNMPRKRRNAAFVRSPSADRIVDAALRNLGYQKEYFSYIGHMQSTIIPHIMWIHPWYRFLKKMKVARLEMLRSKRM